GAHIESEPAVATVTFLPAPKPISFVALRMNQFAGENFDPLSREEVAGVLLGGLVKFRNGEATFDSLARYPVTEDPLRLFDMTYATDPIIGDKVTLALRIDDQFNIGQLYMDPSSW